MILPYLRSVFLAELFPFPLSTFADQQKRKMNASISDAEAPFSHLLRSRFHIKLVIAYDPARYDSHSGGPCYINEICWNANIYAHTFTLWGSLIIASTWVLWRATAVVISYIKLYYGIGKHDHAQAQTWNPPQITAMVVQSQYNHTTLSTVHHPTSS